MKTTSAPTARIEDIPTALTAAEQAALVELAVNQVVIEVGSLLGASTVRMAKVAQRVFAIDPHRGYPEHEPRPTLTPFLMNLETHGVLDKVIPILGRGQDVLALFDAGPGFIFLDTMGDYKGTLELLRLADLINPQVIAVHDYGRRDSWNCEGVDQAVTEFCKVLRLRWHHARTVDTLAILQRSSR